MRTGASFEQDRASGTIGQPSATDAGLTASSARGVPLDTMIGNKYRVERVLGEGAMGIVLGARHVELDELVAIKCIRAEVPWSTDVLARFAREAKAAARLKSEHIAKVIDVGVSAPIGPYMVMEYLEGEDLASVLRRRGPIPARRAAEYVMQVCEALAAAHAASITHRDVKPANLFLTRNGALDVIKVLDFGVSKAPLRGRMFGGEMAVQETQSLIGTPLYMSPEQIRASHEVDHRSDLWSLGAVLFELLTGRAAFAGRTVAQVCMLVLEGSAPPLAQHCASAPAGLAEIIERCLMKDPAQRFQSAAELADALLPFAPARARLHAERATSVLRELDPNEEPLPSTKPNRRRARAPEWSLETTGPMVLGAVATPRDPHGGRRPWLAFFAVLLGLGAAYGALRALFATTALAAKPTASLSVPSSPPKRAAPQPPNPLHDRVAASSSASLAMTSKTRRDASPSRRNAPIGRGSAPVALKVAASAEPAPPAPLATKPRVRLLDEGSLVKLIQ